MHSLTPTILPYISALAFPQRANLHPNSSSLFPIKPCIFLPLISFFSILFPF